jgi:hypothetical protein
MALGDNDRWQAEQDAYTLAEAKVIQSDKDRLQKAVTAASQIVESKKKDFKAMEAVSNKKPLTSEKENAPFSAPRQNEVAKSKKRVLADVSGLNIFKKI